MTTFLVFYFASIGAAFAINCIADTSETCRSIMGFQSAMDQDEFAFIAAVPFVNMLLVPVIIIGITLNVFRYLWKKFR